MIQDAQSEVSQSEAGSALPAGRGQLLTTGRMSNQSTHSRLKRSSISSLPQSLINLGEVRLTEHTLVVVVVAVAAGAGAAAVASAAVVAVVGVVVL